MDHVFFPGKNLFCGTAFISVEPLYNLDSFNHEIIISRASILNIVQMFWNCFFQASNIELINTFLLYFLRNNFWRQSHPPHSLRKIFSYSISVSKYLRWTTQVCFFTWWICKYMSMPWSIILVSSRESFGKIPKD